MLITDYSEQDYSQANSPSKVSLSEIITAGMIFIFPIIFLLIIAAS